ncbi:MAG TPA: bifunctional riboflavin kinase/FAD synthetase [Candidatus Polarisedimenticolia bacterium]|jgi:riboflavin kinase/FMN adenylyltransferase|nr:bifunctional riboflavin kinase/FAD synthetase [Candidatus Polarisedimenticolia bacterium]
MRAARDFTAWPNGPIHLAIGVFDGVHLGHRALIAQLASGATADDSIAVAATFDPLPIHVLAPGAPASALSDVSDRVRLLREAGAQEVVIFGFDDAFAKISADEFVDRVVAAGEVRRIVVGPDFHFGRRAEGDVEKLRTRGERDGFAIDVMTPVQLDGSIVSATRIRNLLLAGDVESAARLLGRPYSVRGRVMHGAKRGRALGFPTINLALPNERLLPRDGIYAVWAEMGEGRFKAAATLGVRPTMGGGERVLEAYLLDVTGEIYADEVEVAFMKRLRDEIAFASPAELSAQIARDVEETKRAL